MSNGSGFKAVAGILGALIFVLLGGGCQTAAYYSQAIRGQAEIWRKQQSIRKLLADPATPVALKQRLELVLRIRAYAETSLHLPVHGHYLRYVDLGRPYVVWNVFAAPELSLEPKSWWYPIVGRLEYRGFFSEDDARRTAERLQREGFDSYVGGVTAYSTLGWFRDPVLNTFVFEDEAALAEVIFHELAHQRVFFPDDTEFNEAFATVAAQESTEHWLAAGGSVEALARYRLALKEEATFAATVIWTVSCLKNIYTNLPPKLTDAERARLLAQKYGVLGNAGKDYDVRVAEQGLNGTYRGWFKRPLNNARLNTVETYHALVPTFRMYLKEPCGGNLDVFFREMERLRPLQKERRRQHVRGGV